MLDKNYARLMADTDIKGYDLTKEVTMINFLWIKRSFFSSLFLLTVVSTPMLTIAPVYATEMPVAAVEQGVNINTADAKSLSKQLVGVGISRAQKIVQYRDNNGPFTSVDDLRKVKGVGKSIINKNRERIVLE